MMHDDVKIHRILELNEKIIFYCVYNQDQVTILLSLCIVSTKNGNYCITLAYFKQP